MAAEPKLSYLCTGFYPIEADNLMHAAFLFAVWRARRKYGAGAKCTRLHIQIEPGPDGGTFEAHLTNRNGINGTDSEPYLFTVVVDRPRPST